AILPRGQAAARCRVRRSTFKEERSTFTVTRSTFSGKRSTFTREDDHGRSTPVWKRSAPDAGGAAPRRREEAHRLEPHCRSCPVGGPCLGELHVLPRALNPRRSSACQAKRCHRDRREYVGEPDRSADPTRRRPRLASPPTTRPRRCTDGVRLDPD